MSYFIFFSIGLIIGCLVCGVLVSIFFIKKYLSTRKIKYKVNLSWKVIEMILGINILMMDMMRIKKNQNLNKKNIKI